MNDNPYQDIAKEFLDLWQKQMTSVMGDKKFIHTMLDLFQNMQSKTTNAGSNANATTAHTADAPRPEHELFSQLAFRLAMCEKRLAALEGKKTTTITRKRTTKPNPKRVKKPHS